MLELLTEPRETLTYIEHFIEVDKETGEHQEETMHRVRQMGKARRSMPSLGAPFSQNIPGSSLTPHL